MKLGFPCSQPGSVKPPTEIKPEAVGLPAPLSAAAGTEAAVDHRCCGRRHRHRRRNGAGVLRPGARTFNGAYAIFPLMIIFGVVSMLFGGRFWWRTADEPRKMDALRARFMLVPTICVSAWARAADAPGYQLSLVSPAGGHPRGGAGGPRMWERFPRREGLVVRCGAVGVGMTALTEKRRWCFRTAGHTDRDRDGAGHRKGVAGVRPLPKCLLRNSGVDLTARRAWVPADR